MLDRAAPDAFEDDADESESAAADEGVSTDGNIASAGTVGDGASAALDRKDALVAVVPRKAHSEGQLLLTKSTELQCAGLDEILNGFNEACNGIISAELAVDNKGPHRESERDAEIAGEEKDDGQDADEAAARDNRSPETVLHRVQATIGGWPMDAAPNADEIFAASAMLMEASETLTDAADASLASLAQGLILAVNSGSDRMLEGLASPSTSHSQSLPSPVHDRGLSAALASTIELLKREADRLKAVAALGSPRRKEAWANGGAIKPMGGSDEQPPMAGSGSDSDSDDEDDDGMTLSLSTSAAGTRQDLPGQLATVLGSASAATLGNTVGKEFTGWTGASARGSSTADPTMPSLLVSSGGTPAKGMTLVGRQHLGLSLETRAPARERALAAARSACFNLEVAEQSAIRALAIAADQQFPSTPAAVAEGALRRAQMRCRLLAMLAWEEALRAPAQLGDVDARPCRSWYRGCGFVALDAIEGVDDDEEEEEEEEGLLSDVSDAGGDGSRGMEVDQHHKSESWANQKDRKPGWSGQGSVVHSLPEQLLADRRPGPNLDWHVGASDAGSGRGIVPSQ